MTDTQNTNIMPDRLSIDPDSAFFNADILRQGIGIRFRGKERTDVEEYCVSENWIRVQAGKTVDRRGKALTIKLTGEVEAYIQNPDSGETPE
jgi:hypothetical protein